MMRREQIRRYKNNIDTRFLHGNMCRRNTRSRSVSDLTIGHVKRREQQIIEEEEENKDEVMKQKTELNLDEFHRELVLVLDKDSGGLRIVSNGVRPAVLETFRDFQRIRMLDLTKHEKSR